ncbi:MAG: hypothetical protein HYX32_04210 [Actinobacteria bacterium]|nr:hypothetical protein [Actinomycetota bacterium]
MGNVQREVAGRIEGVDANDVARVLLGNEQEEWFIPTDMLPVGAGVGDRVRFTKQDGRLVVIGMAAGVPEERSIEDRLSRPISAKRTSEFEMSELRAARALALDAVGAPGAAGVPTAAEVKEPEAPRPPARTRASRQRRW